MGKVHFVESSLITEKYAGTGPKSSRSAKGICRMVAMEKVKGAIPEMVAPERLAIFVERKGIKKPGASKRILR